MVKPAPLKVPVKSPIGEKLAVAVQSTFCVRAYEPLSGPVVEPIFCNCVQVEMLMVEACATGVKNTKMNKRAEMLAATRACLRG